MTTAEYIRDSVQRVLAKRWKYTEEEIVKYETEEFERFLVERLTALDWEDVHATLYDPKWQAALAEILQ